MIDGSLFFRLLLMIYFSFSLQRTTKCIERHKKPKNYLSPECSVRVAILYLDILEREVLSLISCISVESLKLKMFHLHLLIYPVDMGLTYCLICLEKV